MLLYQLTALCRGRVRGLYIYDKKGACVMLKRMFCAVAVSVLAMNGMAMGAVVGDVFTEDFEGMTVGLFPTPNAAPGPYWIDHMSGAAGPSHMANPVVKEATWGNTTKFYGVDAYADSRSWGAVSHWAVAPGADPHPEEFIFEFDMMVRETAPRGPSVRLVDLESGGYNVVAIEWLPGPGGITFAGGVAVADGVSEEWNHYKLIVNTNTTTASLSVDGGTPVVVNYTPESAAKPTPDGVMIYGVGNKYVRRYFLDNFRLEVIPEPASLALLGMGGLFMLSRRRSQQ
jgi:hypothetical protein